MKVTIILLAAMASSGLCLPAVYAGEGATASPLNKAQTYAIDARRSRVTISVGKAGPFKFAGHEHEVAAPAVTGEVMVDSADVRRSSVNVSFAASALRVTGRGEPPGDVPKVQAKMVGPGVLDAARFPTITFRSVSVAGKAGAAHIWDLEVTGDLVLRGVTRRLRLPVRVRMDGDSLTATGTAVVRQTDFGIKPISVVHLFKVKNEVAVAFRIVALTRRR